MAKRPYKISNVSLRFLIDRLRQRVLVLENPIDPPYFEYREVKESGALLEKDSTVDVKASDVVILLFDLTTITTTNPIYNICNSSGSTVEIVTSENQDIYVPFGKVKDLTLQDGESITLQLTADYWRSL